MSKSLHLRAIAGNTNLRGKFARMMSCRCCVVFNLKKVLEDRRTKKEAMLYAAEGTGK